MTDPYWGYHTRDILEYMSKFVWHDNIFLMQYVEHEMTKAKKCEKTSLSMRLE